MPSRRNTQTHAASVVLCLQACDTTEARVAADAPQRKTQPVIFGDQEKKIHIYEKLLAVVNKFITTIGYEGGGW